MASVWWVTNGVEHLGCFVIAPDASEAKMLARRSFLAHTEPRTGECWSRLAARCCGPADPGWRSELVDARGPGTPTIRTALLAMLPEEGG
jgi:hypothetical protein